MNVVCNLSVIPVRREPSDKSEQATQLLFGETAEITGEEGNWRKIRITHDNYIGWVDKKQILQLTDQQWSELNAAVPYVSSDLVQLAIWNKSQICPVVIGSSLPRYNSHKFILSDTEISYDGNVIDVSSSQPNRMIEQSYMYLNSPYQWGGRSPFGIDCSGLTQMVFKLCGMKLNRDAYQQAEQGETVNLIEESVPGDLAFFDNAEGKIVHVGIILPANHIIHCSGRVRIDRIDHQGIFNEETRTYSHKLRIIKRMF
jgi:cell wall-associated NlpC family hydrolase